MQWAWLPEGGKYGTYNTAHVAGVVFMLAYTVSQDAVWADIQKRSDIPDALYYGAASLFEVTKELEKRWAVNLGI